MTNTKLAQQALESFLQDHPSIKYIPPSSVEYPAARKIFNSSRRDTPLAIVQPQSAEDVSKLVQFVKHNGIKFSIRAMGHDLEGRSIVQDALTIDLRGLKSVVVSADRQSATVQGGVSHGELATSLWKEGLATPYGVIPDVGYVGWAFIGGYGPFMAHFGLGVDQIIGATVVDANGDIIQADAPLLKGIRGGGGSFGVVLDLTVKVYPLESVSVQSLFFFFFFFFLGKLNVL